MRSFLWFCALTASVSMSAYALSISPTRIIVNEDSGSRVSVRLAGESGPLPIEVSVLERLPGGALVAVPESVIRAHPPQILLNPGEARNIQIDISSGIIANNSRSFYLRIEELGLNTANTGAGNGQEIVLLATYLLPVHVLGGHAGVLTAEIALAPEDAQVVLSNAGSGPALLSSCRLGPILTADRVIELDGRQLAEQVGSDAILPGETVRLNLSLILSGSTVPSGSSVIGVRTSCDRFQ